MLRDGDGKCADQDRAVNNEVRCVELERSAGARDGNINVEHRCAGRVSNPRPSSRSGSICRRVLRDCGHGERAGRSRAARVTESQRRQKRLRRDRIVSRGRLRAVIDLDRPGASASVDGCFQGVECVVFAVVTNRMIAMMFSFKLA